jgi:hypothetical protein
MRAIFSLSKNKIVSCLHSLEILEDSALIQCADKLLSCNQHFYLQCHRHVVDYLELLAGNPKILTHHLSCQIPIAVSFLISSPDNPCLSFGKKQKTFFE